MHSTIRDGFLISMRPHFSGGLDHRDQTSVMQERLQIHLRHCKKNFEAVHESALWRKCGRIDGTAFDFILARILSGCRQIYMMLCLSIGPLVWYFFILLILFDKTIKIELFATWLDWTGMLFNIFIPHFCIVLNLQVRRKPAGWMAKYSLNISARFLPVCG